MLCRETVSIDGWLELVEVSAEKQAVRLKTGALLEARSNWYHINLPRKLSWRKNKIKGENEAVPHIFQIYKTREGCGRSQGSQGVTSTTQSLLETKGSEKLTLQLTTALPARHLLISYAFLLNFHPCIHVSWWFCSCLCTSWGFWDPCLWFSTQLTLTIF